MISNVHGSDSPDIPLLSDSAEGLGVLVMGGALTRVMGTVCTGQLFSKLPRPGVRRLTPMFGNLTCSLLQ